MAQSGNEPFGGAGNEPAGGSGNEPRGGRGQEPPADFRIENPFKGGDSILDLLRFIINDIILPLGVTIAVFFLIYSGFLFVTAQGSEQKLEKAKSTFLWTVVGSAVLLGAWTIAQAIAGTLCQITTVPGLCS